MILSQYHIFELDTINIYSEVAKNWMFKKERKENIEFGLDFSNILVVMNNIFALFLTRNGEQV